jgi:hypothetical protein
MLVMDEMIRERRRRREHAREEKERELRGKGWWGRKWGWVRFLVC